MAPLAGPRVVVVPLSGTESRTRVAKGGHGQRKGLAYPQRAGVSSRVKRRRSSPRHPSGLNRPDALDVTCHAPRTGGSRCERDEYGPSPGPRQEPSTVRRARAGRGTSPTYAGGVRLRGSDPRHHRTEGDRTMSDQNPPEQGSFGSPPPGSDPLGPPPGCQPGRRQRLRPTPAARPGPAPPAPATRRTPRAPPSASAPLGRLDCRCSRAPTRSPTRPPASCPPSSTSASRAS